MLQSGLLWAAALGVCVAGCGATARNQCRLDALEAIPEDPGQATGYDAVHLAERLKACEAPATPDGGVP